MTNQEKWIAFCAEHDDEISIYDKPFWLDAVCYGRQNWDVFLVEENGEIQGALPFYMKKRCGMSYITMPQLTQRNAIWLRPIESEKLEKRINREYKVYKMLIEQFDQKEISFYHQCFSTDMRNWQPFYWKGYRQKTLYTFCIDSPYDLEEAEKNFSQSARANLRKAMLNGTFGEFDDVRLFHEINSKTFARQNMENPISIDLMERLYEACKKNNAVKMLYAKDKEGNVCDVAMFVYDATTVYALMCGTDPSKRKYNFHTVLTYEGIKFACETGRKLDFEGSMLEGVATSLLSFGAEMYPYYSIKKVFTKIPIVSQYLKFKLYA